MTTLTEPVAAYGDNTGTTPRILIVDDGSFSAAALALALPAGWTVATGTWPGAFDRPTLVVFAATSADAVRATRRRHPGAALVVVIPQWDDGTAAIDVLGAGADVCVRGRDTDIVRAFVEAAARRVDAGWAVR